VGAGHGVFVSLTAPHADGTQAVTVAATGGLPDSVTFTGAVELAKP